MLTRPDATGLTSRGADGPGAPPLALVRGPALASTGPDAPASFGAPTAGPVAPVEACPGAPEPTAPCDDAIPVLSAVVAARAWPGMALATALVSHATAPVLAKVTAAVTRRIRP